MPSQDSILSTNLPVEFFDGASRTSSTTHYAPSMQVRVTSDANDYTFAWELYGNAGHMALTAPLPEDGARKFELLARLSCHYLVEHVSEDGLNELVTTLKDMAAFYSDRVELLEQVGQAQEQSRARPVQAVRGRSFTRESFELDDQ